MASIEIRQLSKAFGSVEVLRTLDLSIVDGEFLVLVGPSGCGKSTLLRAIAGLEEVSNGQIFIGDRRVDQLQPKDRDIAMVFQSYALYPNMSVYENMAFGLKVRGFAASEIDNRIQKAGGILALTPLFSRYPKELSGGQRQRVAMGRAMVRDPQVFLFDEPLSNLDAKLRVAMRTEIKALQQRLGTTTVYVTHDQIEAMTMADRIVILNGGKIEQIGAPMEVYNRPANQFVAGFIGSPAMNFITGRLRRSGGVPALQVDDGNSIKLPGTSISLEEGAPMVLGVRPEHLGVATNATSESLSGRVLVTEPSGATTQVVSVYAGQQVSAVLPEYREFMRDEPVHLVPDMRQIHLFDSQGARVVAH